MFAVSKDHLRSPKQKPYMRSIKEVHTLRFSKKAGCPALFPNGIKSILLPNLFLFFCFNRSQTGFFNGMRALLEIRYDMFSRGFERDSKAGCGRQHNEAAWPELHARRNAIRL
ncbi:hypothetical protein, partial [Gluconobacter oxydans]|uniref:hypothetical protein n=1 Tax=Gluconobacter oxydans TaxID=442 RepID=UPI00209EC502